MATETVESIKNGVIRTLKYDRYGHLLSVSLYINADKEEAFVFDKDKKPIAHWVGDKGHEITTKTKLSRELIYSAQ